MNLADHLVSIPKDKIAPEDSRWHVDPVFRGSQSGTKTEWMRKMREDGRVTISARCARQTIIDMVAAADADELCFLVNRAMETDSKHFISIVPDQVTPPRSHDAICRPRTNEEVFP